MKLRFITVYILALSVLFSLGSGAASPSLFNQQSVALISPQVFASLDQHEFVDIMIKMQEQVDTTQVVRQLPVALNSPQQILAQRSAVVNALQSVAKQSQKPVLRELSLMEKQGLVKNVRSLWVVNVIAARVKKDALTRLTYIVGVESISLDLKVPLPLTVEAHSLSPLTNGTVEWNIIRVGAPAAWEAYGVTGEGITVGIIDTGVHWTHPALKTKWRGYDSNDPDNPNPIGNWLDAVNGQPLPYDQVNHGTHVLGTILGYDPGTDRYIGVAPGAKWIAANAFTEDGGQSSWLLAAGEFMLAPNGDPALAPHIINNSWGAGPELDEWFRPMVQAWRNAGIIPVFAAGNSYPETVVNPGYYPESYAVAALDADNKRAYFSCVGPGPYPGVLKPDIAAPGVNILSAIPNGYAIMHGTSMAAPHITGIAALLLSKDNTLTPVQIFDLINSSATPLTDLTFTSSPNFGYGYGLANAYDAITLHLLRKDDPVENCTVTGQILDLSTKLPIAGVQVEMLRGFLHYATSTDNEGRFIMDNLHEGDYSLQVMAQGYFGTTIMVTASAGLEETIALQLRPVSGNTELLAYDAGIIAGASAASGLATGFAVLMTPQDSAYIQGMSVFLYDHSFPSPGSDKFWVGVYDIDEQGNPGRPLVSPFVITGIRGQWNYVDLYEYGITVKKDYLVVVLMPGDYPDVPAVAYDESVSHRDKDRSYYWSYGQIELIPKRNYMIRSHLTYEPSPDRIDRISGSNRYETAVEISIRGWSSSDTVIIARGDDFADALAGVPLSYQHQAPILLTRTHILETETAAEILRLGTTKVIILGGTGAISEKVAQDLIALGLSIERLGGQNRFETAALIAQLVAPTGASTVILANGMSFPDALSVGPYAARLGYPILLTTANTLPQETIIAISLLDPNQTLVIGGTGVISDNLLTQLPAPQRIAGINRYATNIAVAQYFNSTSDHAFVATGRNFADALTGAALAARVDTCILLVDLVVPSELQTYMNESQLLYLSILGGSGVVSETITDQLYLLLK